MVGGMSASSSSIVSVIGIAAALYSTAQKLLSKQAKATLRDIYETNNLKLLIYFDSIFAPSKHNRQSDRATVAPDDAVKRLEAELKRLEIEYTYVTT